MLLFVTVACKKEEVVDVHATTSLQLSAKEELDALIAEYRNDQGSERSTISSATSANQIPTALYFMDIDYRRYYSHIHQGQNMCSWTSYALAANMVSEMHGKSYPLSQNHINHIKSTTGNSSYIHYIESYAKNNESNFVTVQRPRLTSRFAAIKYMLQHLGKGIYSGEPFITIVAVNGRNHSLNGNDVDSYNKPSKSYWIDPINHTTAHYIIVVGINWKQGGTGSVVYYYDPLSRTGNIQSCSFTRLLDAMTASRYSRNRNVLSIKP